MRDSRLRQESPEDECRDVIVASGRPPGFLNLPPLMLEMPGAGTEFQPIFDALQIDMLEMGRQHRVCRKKVNDASLKKLAPQRDFWSFIREGGSMPGQIPAAQLATLTYRSKASSAFPRDGLDSILDVARSRNHALSVTGLLIYDNGRIFQWLEGPPDSVANIWQSIRQDPRHMDIEVLEYSVAADRVFGEWDMKLATKPPQSPLVAHGYVPLSLAMMAPTLVVGATLSKGPGPRYPAVWTSARRRMLPLAHPRTAELAQLLLKADPAQAFALLDLLTAESDSIGDACASVSEPAARSLGELWAADDCTEVDVLLGLGRLRSAIRHFDLSSKDRAGGDPLMKTVLVVPQPGEKHMIGAALDAEVLCRDGFEPTCEFPLTNDALNQIVCKQWFDAIDVSLSSAFMREESLPRMAQTIACARQASLNPNVIVVVGGRAFYENVAVAATVGADEAHMSALQVPQSIRSVSGLRLEDEAVTVRRVAQRK